ncbi:hypothetical protein TNCV_4162551 [Trichonephila clavipes]|nr:hypothetical protein TNCV_4162551 [Trichonephila clavipes]
MQAVVSGWALTRRFDGISAGLLAILVPIDELDRCLLTRAKTCSIAKSGNRVDLRNVGEARRQAIERRTLCGRALSYLNINTRVRKRKGYTMGTVSRRSTSDEAHFWLNGCVNKQNCRIWSEANPQVYVETPLHPEKLTVWCALWAGGMHLVRASSKAIKATTLQSMVIGIEP